MASRPNARLFPLVEDQRYPPGEQGGAVETRPPAYGPWLVYQLANGKRRGTQWATRNADNYAWLANSLLLPQNRQRPQARLVRGRNTIWDPAAGPDRLPAPRRV